VNDNVVDISKRQDKAKHDKKQAGFDKMRERFETAFPSEKSPKEKLLGIFKKEKKKANPNKKK
jgi:hypothetical protein